MINNYIKVATRNILKRKLYSFINAFGLSIGIAFCVLIYLYIEDERSFDQFHANKENIYRIEARSFNTWRPADGEGPYQQHASLQTSLGPVLVDELPEVEFATRFNGDQNGILRYDGKVFTEKITFVDGDFFKMFSFRLLSGNPDKLFINKSEVVLTEEIAKKYFGDADPIGKNVLIDCEGEKSYMVAGIIEAPPSNSSFDFKILIPQENRPYYQQSLDNWSSFNSPTFVQLVPGTKMKTFESNLAKIVDKKMGSSLERWRKESAIPVPADAKMLEYKYTKLPDMHLRKEIRWHKVSDPQYSLILGGIATLILVIACINYISLALTTSTSRRTEVGIRKAVGAQKKQLVYQFGLESILLAFVSMFIGILLVILFLPAFNQYTQKGIELSFNAAISLVGIAAAITVVVGILAGSYPALFLSGFKPTQVLKGRFTSKLQAGFTKPLVVFQFALSAFLIISSVIMYRQMEFVTTKELGYNREQVLVIPTQTGWNPEADKAVEQFRTHTQNDRHVISVAGTSSSFNQGYSIYGYKIDGEQRSAYVFAVDADYIPALGMELAKGRNFDPNIASDSSALIVNEALVKDMGWTDPLNEYLNWREDSTDRGSKIIGVVKDYHFLPLQQNIEPAFLSTNRRQVGHLITILVRLAPGDLTGSLDKVKKSWMQLFPDRPFDFTFLDEDVARQYDSIDRWMSIMGLATGFAILISCLGLFGLAGINAVNRTKEIGIRKVMGAELSNIFVLLNKQFVWLSLIAFAVAAPASWYIMVNWWLSDFKFKVTIGWELFAISMLCGLVVSLATVSYHAIKAALVNPAETLKYE